METKIEKGSSEKPSKTVIGAAAKTAADELLQPGGIEAALASALNEEPETPEPKPKGQVEGEQQAEEGEPAEEVEAGEHAEADGEEAEGKEGEEKAEGEVEETEGEEEEPIEGLDAETQERIDKRIGKVVKQREELKGKVAELESRATAAEAERDRLKTAGNRPSETEPEEAIARQQETAEQLLSDAQAVLDDTANEDERGRVEQWLSKSGVDGKKLRTVVRRLEQMVQTELPKQREAARNFKTLETQMEPVVKKYFPWIDDPKAPEYAEVTRIKALMPELSKRTPAHRVAIGVYLLGLKEYKKLMAETAAAATAKAGTKPAAKPPAAKPPKNAPAAQPKRPTGDAAARQKFEAAPTAENVTELLRQSLRAA